MPVSIRPARPEDGQSMCDLLNPIIADGTTTAHRRPFDPARMIADYIAPPRLASCVTAWDLDQLTGFQLLVWPDPDWTDWDTVPADCGLIGSFVARSAQGRGFGQAMFAATLETARNAGMAAIDATIRADNVPGLACYSRLGFVDYDKVAGVPLSDGTPVDRIRKVYRLAPRTRSADSPLTSSRAYIGSGCPALRVRDGFPPRAGCAGVARGQTAYPRRGECGLRCEKPRP